ncbi:hypothetical protein ACFO4E_25115 [Nocardiopsis mangrovi]|uniref:Carrier domain-containing protein n=1 Tax=Nocardiopsis mangrovi TaxID=1179818 RepID=A0ABV9E1V4_9ACTN
MLEKTIDVRAAITARIRDILAEAGGPVRDVPGGLALHELGLSSLMLARLLIENEGVFEVDPFADGDVLLSDVATVDDLVSVYENALAATAQAG